MIRLIGLLVSLASPSAFAGSTLWHDLMTDDAVVLTQQLRLPGATRGEIIVAPGEHYHLASITPLEGISVIDYLFVPERCGIPQIESKLTLVLPRESLPNSRAEVGVYFIKGCRLEVLVETKDLGKVSFFLQK